MNYWDGGNLANLGKSGFRQRLVIVGHTVPIELTLVLFVGMQGCESGNICGREINFIIIF
jgi:hypothetical protein